MSLLKLKFLEAMPNPASFIANAAISTGESLATWFGKLQGQINALKAREQTWSKVVNVNNTLTFSFGTELGVTFAVAPRVQLTVIEPGTSNPYVAQLTGTPSTTSCSIRCWMVGTLLGANQQAQANVVVTVSGVAS